MAGGFKIADAYVEIQTRAEKAEKTVDTFGRKLKAVDDKLVKIDADDSATPIITNVDRREIGDKEALIKADDQASAKLDQLDSTKLEDKNLLVKADTDKAESAIKNVGSAAEPVDIPVKADTGPVSQALQGLGDLGTNIGDDLTGGLTSGMMGGVAGAVAAVGGALAAGLIDKISEGNKIQRALELQFRLDPSVTKQYAELFDTNMFEDINHFLGGGMADQTRQALEDIGIGAEQLSTNMVTLSRTFSDFNSMGVADQRALTMEMTRVAAAAGIDVPEALKGASAAAKTWGMSGWDATRLLDKGFQQLDSRGDDLADTFGEYSPMFKRMGLDGNESLRLISTGLDHGARNTDVMADSFKELGIRVVDGSALSRDAMQDLGLDVDKTMAAFGKGGPQAKEAMDAIIDKLNATQDPIERNRLGVALLGTQWEDTMRDVAAFIDVMPGTTTALNSSGIEAQLASEKAKGLSDAFTALKGPFESAAKTADLVSDALDRMNQRTPNLRDTTQAWNDLVREFSGQVDWDDAAKGVQRLGGSLVGLKGEVDTTTAAGSKLEDWAQRSKQSFMEQAGALREAGVPADEMSAKLGVMRDAFIRNAEAQGLPREAAVRLANAYGLVPKEVSTAIYAPNLLQRMGELNMLSSRIVTLPDGRFTVESDTGPAQRNITKLVTDNQGKVITLQVTTSGASAGLIRNVSGGGRPFLAEGGPVVGPGTGTSDDVPLMGSNGEWMIRERVARKNRPFLEWFNEHGDTQPIQAFAQGGPIGTASPGSSSVPGHAGDVHIHITPPAELDYNLIAAKVSRTLELARKAAA
jgi:hypothetical protein